MTSAGRGLRARTGLPSSRAVVGGLLVAVAAVGTWAVAYGAGATPGDRYLVASRPIGPGQRIGAADLSWSTQELSAATRAGAFADARALTGAVALGPIEPGELVQAGAVAPAAGAPDEGEVSFAVEAEWAVAGTLRSGDRIDVFATTEAASGATSRRVLGSAVVRSITSTGGDGLGESRRQIVTVAVRRDEEVEAVVTAARAATITVVRVTGSAASPTASADASESTDGESTDDAPPRTTTTTATSRSSSTAPSTSVAPRPGNGG